MKKKLISIGTFTLIAAMSFIYFTSQANTSPSSLLMQNVEALAAAAEGGGGGGGNGKSLCYSQYVHSDNASLLRCHTCDYVNGVGTGKSGYCK